MNNNKEILKKYVCLQPFSYLDVQEHGDFLCCPSWCTTNIRANEELVSWNSAAATSVRESMLDGSYSHCQHDICPSLVSLLHTNEVPQNFLTHKEFAARYGKQDIKELVESDYSPEEILFGFDRSCNLKCPSCRSSLVPNDNEASPENIKKEQILNFIELKYAKSVKKLLITGSGDPFYSKIYRNYLINFNKNKYPNIEKIHLITNAQLLNKKIWENMASRSLVESIEISIDAGTKETYEKITRLGGHWETLIDNLKYISSSKDIKFLLVSMVVSEKNYSEMRIFYDLMMSIFNDSSFTLSINFRQHVYWGAGKYTQDEVQRLQVFSPTHPKFRDFLTELLKIHQMKNSNHNFHHLIEQSF